MTLAELPTLKYRPWVRRWKMFYCGITLIVELELGKFSVDIPLIDDDPVDLPGNTIEEAAESLRKVILNFFGPLVRMAADRSINVQCHSSNKSAV